MSGHRWTRSNKRTTKKQYYAPTEMVAQCCGSKIEVRDGKVFFDGVLHCDAVSIRIEVIEFDIDDEWYKTLVNMKSVSAKRGTIAHADRWYRKLSSIVSCNRYRERMRSDLIDLGKESGARTQKDETAWNSTWSPIWESACQLAISKLEMKDSRDPWERKLDNWRTNGNQRMRRKEAASRSQSDR